MKCFHHKDIDAIGICKLCHKGLCMECAKLVDNSIMCKTSCREQVAAKDALTEKPNVTTNLKKKSRMFMPLLFVVVGALILLLSYYQTGSLGVSSIMGFVFIGFGIINYAISKKWEKDIATKR